MCTLGSVIYLFVLAALFYFILTSINRFKVHKNVLQNRLSGPIKAMNLKVICKAKNTFAQFTVDALRTAHPLSTSVLKCLHKANKSKNTSISFCQH